MQQQNRTTQLQQRRLTSKLKGFEERMPCISNLRLSSQVHRKALKAEPPRANRQLIVPHGIWAGNRGDRAIRDVLVLRSHDCPVP